MTNSGDWDDLAASLKANGALASMGQAGSGYPAWPNLAAMMFSRAAEWGERPAVWAREGTSWRATSWAALGQAAAGLASALRAHGVEPGDRVLLLAENRPEWPIADLAIMAVRGVCVPAYTTFTPGDIAHVLADSGARAAVVSTRALAQKLMDGAGRAGGLDLVVAMEDVGALAGTTVLPWTEGVSRPPLPGFAEELLAIPGEQTACLIYTSGTGGAPKGVMLPHRALLSNCAGAWELLKPLGLKDEVYLSFLPLSHSYEHTCGQFFLLSIGTQIYYASGADRIAPEMLEVRPTVMTAVPRLFEVIRSRILTGLKREPKWKRDLFVAALALGARRVRGQSLGPTGWFADKALEFLVRRKVRARFGGRLKGIMSGGARLDPDVGGFFLALGIPIMQGYGQTEAGPVIAANPPGRIRIDTVGLPLPNVEVRIANDGEILVRGDLVMQGYWNNPEATEAAIRDGWLHTGDVGSLDEDGYLRITDRKREIIKTTGGDMVSPARVEGILAQQSAIAQAVVAGDGRSHLVALIVPADGADEKEIGLAVDEANRTLTVTERIRHWRAVPAFTIENGLLTSTQKVRRQIVLREHKDIVERMYA
ncbi:AMP-dependent synthetase/ligase [Elioraea rosea]|uniref:AMP-dependent synthetase/ligase n=1 Tax=Elioraea rosea TaxID=2492390 RepID=UPI003084460F